MIMTRTVKPPLRNLRAGLGGLLIYLPNYGVVICKDCQFAIQPSAFSSHLQNHHILRSERRHILDQLLSLHLPAPEYVGVPASDSPRVPHLPVLSGFKCEIAECDYACTSVKRMCQHWSDIHGQPNSKAIAYREARLQTFFRGNKIRYFEVEGPKHPRSWAQKESQLASNKPGIPLPADLADEAADEAQAPPLDHKSLLYMHYYTRHSGFFLNRGNETTSFWIDTIVLEASKHPFLMYSLLCVSAIDKARKTTDDAERWNHLRASSSYCTGAISGYRAAVACPTKDNSTAIVACSRLLGQHELAHDLIRSQGTNHTFTIEDIVEHLVLLRGCTDLMIQLESTLPPDSPFCLPDQVKSGLKQVEENDKTAMPSGPGPIPAGIWLILSTLEAKLKAAALLPESDTLMIRHAIHLLAHAVAHVYDAKEDEFVWAVWNAVEGWLRMPVVSDELLPAMKAAHPAALVVFISWVMILLRRLEQIYDWMLDFSAWFVHVAIRVGQSNELEALVKEIYQLD
ncbi:hypothetical protein GGR55DRAFT_565168 [Xylaria sp. FL0064]|nr:hypothetical protein GGR55DRAFT_565168 [Xylaria sp. FL0064]